jgi:capsular exopolysaccharide synthesis family protein
METLHTEVRKELSDKIGRLQVLSKELGGAETPNASAELNMIIRDIGMIDQRMYTVKEQLNNLEVEFQLRSRDAQSPTALREAVNAELENDPTLKGYGADKYAIEQQIRQFKIISKQATSPQTKQLQQQLVLLIQQEAEYRARLEQEITNRLKSVPNDAMQLIMTEYLMRRQQAQQSLTDLQTERDQKIEEMEALNQENGELVMLKANVEQLQEIERQMDYKIRSWKVVDESADDRVKVIQEASVMDSVNRFERYGIVSLGSLAAFCLTCYGVALVEFTRRKLNSPADVDEGLGIRVLGVLPPVSGRKGMAPGSLLAAQLAESIDNVRATLMHDSTSRPRQIVLVASPSSMEGSTTVASHLALSLTRAGRRTLLIDGDLRDPALHKLFGMPLEDGVSELLRSEIEVADAIRPTNTEGLWLMTAGVCDMDAIHALATSQLQPVFEKLRTEFDFVIIDGAPVLGLTDSLSIGQHIDGAILTVLRDHSGVREIHQASELLKSLGIRVIGSVVNGMPFKADRRVARMQNLSASRTKRLPAVKEE